MPQIRPITDLRNTNEISELCHSKNEPIFITKNGYGDLVIMSIETYEREIALADVYKKLAVAENQVQDGETLDGGEVLANLKKRFQLQITPAAAHDLDNIYYYITNHLATPQAADNLLGDIEKAILSLSDFPYRCQYSRNEILRDKGYRRMVVHKYVVLYSIDEENRIVIVMRVFYGAMDYEKYV